MPTRGLPGPALPYPGSYNCIVDMDKYIYIMHSVTCNWVLPDESATAFESISSNKQTLDVFWPSFTAIFIEENNAGYLGRGSLQCMIR